MAPIGLMVGFGVVGSVEKSNLGMTPRGEGRPGADSAAPATVHPLADSASPLTTIDSTVNYVPVGSVDPGRGIDHIALANDTGATTGGAAASADTDHPSIDHVLASGTPADTVATGDASAGDAHQLDTLLGPSSVDGIAVRSLGDFDHNHSSAFGGPATGWSPDTDGSNHSTALPTEIAFNHPHLLPTLDIAGGSQGAAAQIAYDQAWLNDMQANLADGLAGETNTTTQAGGTATPTLGTLPTPTDLSPIAVAENASPIWNVHATSGHSINPAPLTGSGAAGIDSGDSGLFTMITSAATDQITNGTGFATIDLNGAQIVTASLASPPALGDTAAGALAQTTFVLDAGETGGTVPLVHIQNFDPAHDLIDIVANLPGLGSTASTSGPNENVFTLTNDAAAQSYAGANAAILVVGSGANADVFYYNPHDASYGNQAHAYQIAEVANTSADAAAGKVAFIHTPTAHGAG